MGTALLSIALAAAVFVYLQTAGAGSPPHPIPPQLPAPSSPSSQPSGAVESEVLARIDERLASLESRLELLEQPERAAPPSFDTDALLARIEALEQRLAQALSVVPAAPSEPAALAPAEDVEDGPVSEKVLAQVDERIDAAVARQAAEFELKKNKKPALDTFAEQLELENYQRLAIENEVREGQRQIRQILETPTADGSNLLDEFVVAIAYGEAKSPEAPGRFMQWFARVTTEKIPGTDQTYSARVEAVKASVDASFRRELSDDQYSEYKDWAIDPTEIQAIEDSPWADFEERVAEAVQGLPPE